MQTHKDAKDSKVSQNSKSADVKNVNTVVTKSSIWTEDALPAYLSYLEYADKKVQGFLNKSLKKDSLLSMFSSTKKETTVTEFKTHTTSISYPSLAEILFKPFKCCKLTLRNINGALLIFQFNDKFIKGMVEIDADIDYAKQFNVDYRDIIPSEFSGVYQLDELMEYREYIIDGNKINEDKAITLSIHPKAAIRVFIEDCKGSVLVRKTHDIDTSKIIVSLSPKSDLYITEMPAKKYG